MTDKQTSLTKDVEAGTVFEGKIQIKKGLKPGESVIVYGGYGLADGTALKLAADQAFGQEEKK